MICYVRLDDVFIEFSCVFLEFYCVSSSFLECSQWLFQPHAMLCYVRLDVVFLEFYRVFLVFSRVSASFIAFYRVFSRPERPKGAQRGPKEPQRRPKRPQTLTIRPPRRFPRVFSCFRGVQGSTGGRGDAPSGVTRKQHFGPITSIFLRVFQHFTFSAPRRLLDSDLSHLSKTPQGR